MERPEKKIMNIKDYAVIFDMDGLLIDSESQHKAAEYRLLQYLKCENLVDLCHNTYGMKTEDALLFLKSRADFPQTMEQAKAYWLEVILREFSGVELMPGAENCLNMLKKLGICVGLCSSSPWELINPALDNLNIRTYFDQLVSGDEVKTGKPEPEIYLACAGKLKVKPENCLALEDAPKGVEAAKRAGMKCFAVPNCHTREFDFSPADKILSSLNELTVELLGETLGF